MTNTHTILLLLLLTIASFFVSDAKAIAPLLLGLGGIKFLLVAFQFVEVKHAHPFWKVMIVVFAVAAFGVIFLLAR